MRTLPGNVTSPMWIDGRIWFLGDGDGVGNLYSCRPDGSDLRRHTDHDDFYARHAQTDGRRIVYQCGADLWLFDPASDSDREVEIRVPAHRTQAARKFVPAAEHLGAFHVHPARPQRWRSMARGKLFAMAALGRRGAPATATPRSARACATASGWPTAAPLVAVSDASGEERIVAFARPRRQAYAALGTSAASSRMRAAPQGSCVALRQPPQRGLDRRRRQRRAAPSIDKPSTGAARISPGRPTAPWLAYTFCRRLRHCAIKLHERRVAAPARSSRSRSSATTRRRSIPTASTCTSCRLRTFDPVYDSVQFELSLPARGAALPDRAAGRRRGRRSTRRRKGAAAGEAERRRDGGRATQATARQRRCASTSTASPPRRGVPGAREPLRPDSPASRRPAR